MSAGGLISLFPIAERRRWQRYLIDLSEICKGSRWVELYFKKLRSELSHLDEDQLHRVRLKVRMQDKTTIDDIMSNSKSAIDIFCYWRFTDYYFKSTLEYLELKGLRGNKLRRAAFIGILALTDQELDGIMLHEVWRQAAVYERTYSFDNFNPAELPRLESKMKRIGSSLSRWSTARGIHWEQPYHFKMNGKFKQYLIFWVLRQKSFQEEPSWPLNKRLRRFATKVLVIDPIEKQLMLIVHNKIERRAMISFIQKNLKVTISPRSVELELKRENLQEALTSENPASSFPIVGVCFSRSRLAGQPQIVIRDRVDKDSVANAVKVLEESGHIATNDIRNLEWLKILFDKRPIKVQLISTKSGYYRFLISERNLTFSLMREAVGDFEIGTKIPINKFFTFEGIPIEIREAINDVLNSKIISLSEKPPIYKSVLEALYDVGLLQKLEKENRRYCDNLKCTARFANTWARGTCGDCGHKMKISGEYFRINADKSRIREFILSELRRESFDAVEGVRYFDRKRTHVIEVYTERGSVLVVPNYSTKIDSNLLTYLKSNYSAVVFVPYPSTSEAQTVIDAGHGVVSVSELAANYLSSNSASPFKTEINRCFNSFVPKVQKIGEDAIKRIESRSSYDFHKFEEDIFALLHVILPSAQRLGDRFIGKKVPDGIAAIPMTKSKRFCITWDCKYSDTQYELKEKPTKTIEYLKKIPELPVVKNLGGLKTFVYLSNSMNEESFKRHAKKVYKKYPWKGKVVLIASQQVTVLYKHFVSIRQDLLSSPEVHNKYYSNLARLFRPKWKRIHIIVDEDVNSVTREVYAIPKFDVRRTDI